MSVVAPAVVSATSLLRSDARAATGCLHTGCGEGTSMNRALPTTLRVTAATAGALLALSACGGSTSSGGGGGSGSAPKIQGNEAGTGGGFATQNPLHPSTAKGGTLNIGSFGDVDYMDPARTYYAFSQDLHQLINRTLLSYPDCNGKNATTPVGDIATGPATPQDGDTVCTYHLKSGIKFQDGTPVTSADIKYAIERTFATSVINGGPSYFQTFLCPGGENSQGVCTSYGGPYKGASSIY